MKNSLSLMLLSSLMYLTVSCVATSKPELIAELDTLARTPAKTFIAPDQPNFTAQPIKAGQWTHYLMIDKDGKRTSFRQLILSQEGPGSFWFETETIAPEGKTVVRSLVSVDDRMRMNAKPGKLVFTIDQFVQLKRLIQWHDGQAQATEIPPQAVQMIGGALGKVNILSNSRMNGVSTVAVKAGTFKRCFKMQSQAQTSFFNSQMQGCVHPSVPLSGLVQATDDAGTRWELVGFGQDGKKSLIQVPIQTASF